MGTTETYKSNLLTITVDEKESSIDIIWTGKSADRTPGVFINPILNEALVKSSAGNKEIIMKFQDLEFMNSSSIATVVKILDRVKRSDNRVTILYQKAMSWQELSFSALFVFQTKDNRIQIKGI